MKLRPRVRILLLAAAAAALMAGVGGDIAAAAAPPVLDAPADGSTVSARPTISWLDSGAASYSTQIADNANFWGPVLTGSSSVVGLSYTPDADLGVNRLYFWRVKGSNWWQYSEYRRFFTPLTLFTPANGATVGNLTPTLDWSDYTARGGPDAGGALYPDTVGYRVQVASSSTFSSASMILDSVTPSSNLVVPDGTLVLNHTYYWRVNVTAVDDGNGWSGTSDWSETRSFIAPLGLPDAPNLVAPANGNTITNWQPVLSWDATPGATSYILHYTNTGTGATTTIWSIYATSYTFTFYLPEVATYEWSVEAVNYKGRTSSATWSFTTPFADPPPPATLISPANTTAVPISGVRPSFSWNATAYTKYYTIDIGTSPTLAGAKTAQVYDASYSFAPDDPDLDWNTIYYWRVNSFNRLWKTTSSVWSFKTPPPPGPSLTSPADGSTVDSRRPTLSWGAVAGVTSYGVQVAANEGFSSLIADAVVGAGTGNSYSVPVDLDYDTLYYWRVNFTNGVGTSLWSLPWSFTGPPPPVPLVPTLQSPGSESGGSIVGLRPTFDWMDSAGSTSFGFQLATNSGFSLPLVSATSLATSGYTLSADLSANTTYFWRANGHNSGGDGPWSSPFSFTTPPPPPAAPTLLAPANGSTPATMRPHFDWSDSSGATSYILELFTDPGLTSLSISEVVTSSEFDPQSDLAAATTFYWTVRAANETSGPGTNSTSSSFSTLAIPPVGVPVLISPAAGAVVDSLTPVLDWNDEAYATSYRVQLGKYTGFVPLIVDATLADSSYSFPSWLDLDADTDYYWRVRAANSAGSGGWSEVRMLHTLALPAVPNPVSPSDGASVSSLTPTLSVDSVSGATSYTVQLSTVSWFATYMTLTSSTPDLAVVSPLAYGTRYYWRARASNAAGSSALSGSRSFVTPPAPPPPAAPTLLTPTSGATVGIRPSFDWSDPSGATRYRLEWSKSATFVWTEANRDMLTLSDFTMDVDLLYSTQYYWRVRAAGDGANGPWSAIFGFRTSAGPPGVPWLISPAEGANSDSPLQKLDWADVSSAAGYQLQLSTDSGFAAAPAEDVAISEFTPASPLATDTTYYWRVRASNAAGQSDWSASRSFVVPAPLGPVTLLAPADGSTVGALKPLLEWEGMAGATGYEVSYSPSGSFAWGVESASVGVTDYTVPVKLPLDKDYYWKVRALNGGGPGSWSEVWRLHTPSTPPPPTEPPAAANLLLPSSGAVLDTLTPTFTWETAEGANSYRVQLSRDSGFPSGGPLVVDVPTLDTSHTLADDLDYSTLYYWRVRALNSIGPTDSLVRSFTTPAPPPPDAPTLTSPIDGSTVDTLGPLFDWDEASRAIGYRFQLSLVSDFGSNIVNSLVTSGSSYSLPSWKGLSMNTLYYWRVQGYNGLGSGAWSTASFTTAGPPPPPAAPLLTSPGAPDGGPAPSVDTLKPTFTWSSSTGATGYRVQISRNSAFTSLVSNTTTGAPSYYLAWPSLSLGSQYWWRVQATNSTGTSDWSVAYTFQTLAPPAAPNLVSPSNGSKTGDLRPTLDWSDVAAATSYHVVVGTNSWFGTKVVDSDVSTWSAYSFESDLSSGGTYYWKVNASNVLGTSGWSATWRFTTPGTASASPTSTPTPTPTPTPGATPTTVPTPGSSILTPILISPGGPAGGGPVPSVDTLKPTFTWSSSAGAAGYRVQVSRNSAFTSLAANTTTGDLSLASVTLTTGSQYWWRVQAYNGSGNSDWSVVYTFQTIAVPAVPSLISPSNGSRMGDLRPTLDWSDVAWATSYHLVVATNSWFGTKVFDSDVSSGSEYSFDSDLSSGTTYYWKVNATNVLGTSVWSATWSFITPGSGALSPTSTPTPTPSPTPGATPTAVPTPGVLTPTLVSPGGPVEGGPALVDSLRPSFTWTSSTGATGYSIQIARNDSFTWLVINTTVYDPSFSALWSNLVVATQYWWRVRANSPAGSSAWSAPFSFVTPAIPGVPGVVSPSNGATAGSLTPVLDWGDVSGVTDYHVTVSSTSWFGSKLVDVNTGGDSSYPFGTDLAAKTTYYWKVYAQNGAGNSGWSATWSFTTPGP